MFKYKNPWHKPGLIYYGPEYFETFDPPIKYKDYDIYETHAGLQYDVVKNNICITQRAGLNGAKRYIDELEEQK